MLLANAGCDNPHGRIVTVEDHGISGGHGSAVTEAVAGSSAAASRYPGDTEGLYGKYGLTTEHISAAAVELMD